MPGVPSLFLAQASVLSARQCLILASPFLVILAFRWLVFDSGELIRHLFPDWEWRKKMGWLDIRAQKQAEAILRWIGYGVYAGLAVALYGIAWAAQSLADSGPWKTAPQVTEGMATIGILTACLTVWLIYLGLELIPKLRNEYEKEELDRFRAEQAELEQEKESHPNRNRPQPTPRLNITLTPSRPRPRGRN